MAMLLLYLVILLGISRTGNTQRRRFFNNNNFERHCYMPNGNIGTCRNIRSCPTALIDREEPITCYFHRFQQFVCCNEHSNYEQRTRPSVRECDLAYPVRYSIVQGERTQPNEFPYMVALGWESSIFHGYDYKCGGVLISSNFILTAAHCAYLSGVAPVVALVGGKNLSDANTKTHTIATTIIHPYYKPALAYHDVALIKLQQPIFDNTPACIWYKFAMNNLYQIAIGYGQTQFAGRSSDELLKTDLLAIPNRECRSYYKLDEEIPSGILESQMCAKDPEWLKDTCQGDSGGPLIMYTCEGTTCAPFIVGITSFGFGCAQNVPGVYTRVSAYADWIESIVWPN